MKNLNNIIFIFSKYKKDIKHDDSKDIRFCFNRWTLKEELYLEKYYPDKGSVWVSKYLHRSPKACALKAHKLGIHRSSKWKQEDDAFLIKNYNEKDARWISEQLKRTESSIRHRVRDLKLKKDSIKWKKIEDDYIIKYHTIKRNIEIANDLNRSLSAVKTRSEYLKKHEAAAFYDNDRIKVISISAIIAKLLENRKNIIIPKPNSTNYRGQLYLHINYVQKDILKYREELNLPRKIQYSYIVARANLVDCKLINEIQLQEIKKNYHEYIYNKCRVGKYIWILKDIEILENPVHARGNTNIWEYDLQLAKEENK